MFNFSIEERIYKVTEEYGALKMYIFTNETSITQPPRPAILFFHGAGFSNNKQNPSQFQYHANHFSSLGYMTICVEYRPSTIEGLFSPIKCLYHAKSAVRWVRDNACTLGIDPNKIVVAGASAGGYLSLCCAMVDQFNDGSDDLTISCVPNAMVVFNGGVDSQLLISLFPDIAHDLSQASPMQLVKNNLPPSIFFHGTLDKNISHDSVRDFVDQMILYGNKSSLISFDGLGHGFFNFGVHDNIPFKSTIKETANFLKENMII
ncbi:alpha/beta hydrolase [Paenibacillus albiflavus]|uniref:alpha/beta hydrolase n=1 Tax=Paenibacillus albiflavus TaxID=2545760 RepID=UPI0014043A68|nr:alpha/beta hydrolase [Paenibacillus albiflavus]